MDIQNYGVLLLAFLLRMRRFPVTFLAVIAFVCPLAVIAEDPAVGTHCGLRGDLMFLLGRTLVALFPT